MGSVFEKLVMLLHIQDLLDAGDTRKWNGSELTQGRRQS